MLRKIFISCLIFSASTSLAFAARYKGETHYKSYKGEIVQPVPVADFTPCLTYNILPGPYIGLNPEIRTNYNQTASVYKGLDGTVFAGYAMLNSSFYLAGEIFAQHGVTLQNYRNNINANLNPVGVKTTWGTGLSILPGFLVADTLLGYLRFGGIVTHFQDVGQSATGGQVGIGLEGTVSESWDLRAEYTYSFYQSMSGIGSPRSDQFRLGVLYKIWT